MRQCRNLRNELLCRCRSAFSFLVKLDKALLPHNSKYFYR
nr:MAG TPA: hypothetical protein [Bacteriophage sp.]